MPYTRAQIVNGTGFHPAEKFYSTKEYAELAQDYLALLALVPDELDTNSHNPKGDLT